MEPCYIVVDNGGALESKRLRTNDRIVQDVDQHNRWIFRWHYPSSNQYCPL